MDFEINFEGNKKVSATIKGIKVMTDQPVKAGGEASAASPFDLFLVSLGTCAGYYAKAFCDERGIPTDNIKIIQKNDYDIEKRMYKKITIEFSLPSDFPEKYKSALISAANLCAVKRHLKEPPEVDVQIV
jgi:putative redox protein